MSRRRDFVDWITLFSVVVFPIIGGVYVYTSNSSEHFVRKEVYNIQSKAIENDLNELKILIKESYQKMESKIDDISSDIQEIKTDQARIEAIQNELTNRKKSVR